MLIKIIQTFIAKFMGSVLNFLLIIVTARFLGAEIRGEIALLVLAITYNNIFANLIGGSALVYLSPRNQLFSLYVPCFAWNIVTSVLGSFVLYALQLFPIEMIGHVIVLSMLAGIISIHSSILLGKEKIAASNIIAFLQTFVLVCSILIFIFILKYRDSFVFVASLYLSYSITLIISYFYIVKLIKIERLQNLKPIIAQFFKFGLQIQLAYILQMLNYRLSYLVLEKYYGKSELGIFSTAISIAEAVWLISKSISIIEYSKISNTDNSELQYKLTINFFKLSLIGTLLAVIPFVILPNDFFIMIFGQEFNNVKKIIIISLPGILSLALSTIFIHYFSGIGKNIYNTLSSGVGLIFTMAGCFILIPLYGSVGAAIVSNISYFASLVFIYIIFSKQNSFKIKDLMISKNDFYNIKSTLIDFLNKKKE